MSDPIVAASLVPVLQAFSGCFTAPSMTSFVTFMTGRVLDSRRHTVTEVQRLFDPAPSPSDLRKRLRPLVDYVASAA